MKTKTRPVSDETLVAFKAEYDLCVRFTREALSCANPDLAALLCRRQPYRRQRVFFVLDAGLVAAKPRLPQAVEAYVRAHRGSLSLAASPLVVAGGEAAKNRPKAS